MSVDPDPKSLMRDFQLGLRSPISSAMPDGRPWPRITIVTPSFNQGQYIEETIRSIVQQGYPNLEYFILDGGSKDGSVETIKRFEEHLAFWRTGPDGGHYQAINEGFAKATGDILAWLNSDDVYFPGSLFYIAEVFAALPQVQWLTTTSQGTLNGHGDLGVYKMVGVSSEGILEGFHLPGRTKRCHGWLQQESTFFRRDLLETASRELGRARLDERYALAADYDLWMRLSRIAEIHSTDRLIGAFRSHGANRSRALDSYLREAGQSFEQHRPIAALRRPVRHLLRNLPAWSRDFPGRRTLYRGIALSGKKISRGNMPAVSGLSVSDYQYI